MIMKDMKLVTKMSIGFVLIDLLLLLIGVYGIYSVVQIAGLGGAQASEYLAQYKMVMITLTLAGVIILTLVAAAVIKGLKNSLNQLSDVAKSISQGKVNVELTKKRNDEFGMLIDEYSNVVKNSKNEALVLEAVADGDLTVEVTPQSDEDVINVALKKLVSRNYEALSNIKDVAQQVRTGSSEVASISEALAQGSTQQASAIEEITASIEDIAAKTKQNATEADNAAELVNKAIVNVKRGNEQMTEMMNAMQEINASSESISKIIKVIDDIAFQTNILALNAAVEAARAGEAGKGFAVVAEEVRNLAAKSAAAAAETAELIENSIKKVEDGCEIADGTANALGEITSAVEESEKIINGIADASNYQATAIAQIEQAVEQVSQVVQNNSSTSQKCASASVTLTNQAERMRELLSVFKLGNTKAVDLPSFASVQKSEINNKNEQIISLGGDFGKY
jgi:methyl-accepting chemotaxis protein